MKYLTMGSLLLLTLGSTTRAEAQSSTFGPRPIYLRGSALAWTLSFDESVETVFNRARQAAAESGFEVAARDEENGVLRLVRREEKGAVLDELCRYPIVNYYSWRPIDSYAVSQTSAIGRRQRGESIAQAGRLNGTVHLAILKLGEGRWQVQSICSANLKEWGLVEAGSRGVAEKTLLERFLELMGRAVEVPLPESPILEPSRSNPTRDLHVADLCQKRCVGGSRCSGMFVDPGSLELRCVEEKGEKRP